MWCVVDGDSRQRGSHTSCYQEVCQAVCWGGPSIAAAAVAAPSWVDGGCQALQGLRVGEGVGGTGAPLMEQQGHVCWWGVEGGWASSRLGISTNSLGAKSILGWAAAMPCRFKRLIGSSGSERA